MVDLSPFLIILLIFSSGYADLLFKNMLSNRSVTEKKCVKARFIHNERTVEKKLLF